MGMILKRFSVAFFSILFAFLAGCAPTETRTSTGEYIDDTAITARVKTALTTDADVKARNISVETFRGTVQLSGFVDTPEQRRRAEDLIWGIEGVRAVDGRR
jgi:hyperosmotically inducible periplasmic protein